MNYFTFQSKGKGKLTYLVDLPGYGFAEAPKKNREKWYSTMTTFLKDRDCNVMRCYVAKIAWSILNLNTLRMFMQTCLCAN